MSVAKMPTVDVRTHPVTKVFAQRLDKQTRRIANVQGTLLAAVAFMEQRSDSPIIAALALAAETLGDISIQLEPTILLTVSSTTTDRSL
jgi:hypothetical protein